MAKNEAPKLVLVGGRDVHPLESARSGLLSSSKSVTNSGNTALRYASVDDAPGSAQGGGSSNKAAVPESTSPDEPVHLSEDITVGNTDADTPEGGGVEALTTVADSSQTESGEDTDGVVQQSQRIKPGKRRIDEWSQLLEKVGSTRDQEAFGRLFDHFAPLLKGFCQSHSAAPLNAEVAEELMQEAMIKVWQKADNYDATKAAANTWIFTILRNTRIDYLRKNSKHSVTDNDLETDDIWDEDLDHQPLNELQQSRIKEHISGLLDKIPEDQAFCLRMVYMRGKSHAEIAEELELPLGTVKSRVRLGLKRIESKLKHLDL